MTETNASPSMLDRFRWLSNEIILGTLIAVLSIFTGVASYQGSMTDSDQNKNEIKAMQTLTDANAEYLTANQFIVYDYNMYDAWYLDETGDKAEYFESSFSEQLTASIAANPEDPFAETYYDAMYQTANDLFAEADSTFELASKFDDRGDSLQLVMLITAIGLAFAAWASLLNEKSNMRLMFAILAIITTVLGVIAYLQVPVVAG